MSTKQRKVLKVDAFVDTVLRRAWLIAGFELVTINTSLSLDHLS